MRNWTAFNMLVAHSCILECRRGHNIPSYSVKTIYDHLLGSFMIKAVQLVN